MKKTLILGLFMGLILPFSTFAALDSNLKYGSSGSAVKEVQEFLTDQGVYSGPITGNFYALTLAGVKAYQTREGIVPISGYWGPLTRAQAALSLDLSGSDNEEQKEIGTVTPPDTGVDMAKLLAALQSLKATADLQTKTQQQIVQNTTPVVQTPDPVVTPTVSTDPDFPTVAIYTPEPGFTPSLAQITFIRVLPGDDVLLKIDGLPDYSIHLTSNTIPGNGTGGSYSYHIPIYTGSQEYSYTATITRGFEYKTYTGTFTTLSQ